MDISLGQSWHVPVIVVRGSGLQRVGIAGVWVVSCDFAVRCYFCLRPFAGHHNNGRLDAQRRGQLALTLQTFQCRQHGLGVRGAKDRAGGRRSILAAFRPCDEVYTLADRSGGQIRSRPGSINIAASICQ